MRTAPVSDGGRQGGLSYGCWVREDFGKVSPRRPQCGDGGHRGEESHEADAVARRHGINGEGAGSYEPEPSYRAPLVHHVGALLDDVVPDGLVELQRLAEDRAHPVLPILSGLRSAHAEVRLSRQPVSKAVGPQR